MLVKKRILTIAVILLLACIAVQPIYVSEKIEFEKQNITFKDNNKLRLHSPILINGNEGFTSNNGVRQGSGTKEDPYIISNWKIYPLIKSGINIRNTDAYFIIENCSIIGNDFVKQSGIFLSKVMNGKIKNCYCSKTNFGIIISSSSNNTVENYNCENSNYGLSINGCPSGDTPSTNHNIVRSCTFTNCLNGTYFCCIPNSYNNLIENSKYTNNKNGILFDHLTHYITVVGCEFLENDIGIKIHKTSSNNFIINNIFNDNTLHALDNCKNFWDNGQEHGGNFWSGHDPNKPYNITGFWKNKDNHPLQNHPEESCLIAFYKTNYQIHLTNNKIIFDASQSYNSEEITSYNWDFDDGTIKTGKVVNHSYTSAGIYNVVLIVTDGVEFDTFEKEIEIIELSDNEIHVSEGESIQDAINISLPGDKILVEPGIYYETLVINKPYLSLIGNNKENTIINSGSRDYIIHVNSSFVSVSNFTIIDSFDGGSGIRIGKNDYIVDTANCIINNNYFTKNSLTITVYESYNNKISNNTIVNCSRGIYVYSSYSNLFSDNYFELNTVGIHLHWGSNWNKITRNTFTNGHDHGMYIFLSHHNEITYNEITNSWKGIAIYHTINNKINYNNIYDNNVGIKCVDYSGKLNFKHNWWGSKLGPSGVFGKIRLFSGDEVIIKKDFDSLGLTRGISRFISCYPWEKEAINLS